MAKRKDSGGKGFGRSRELTGLGQDELNGLLRGEQILIAAPFRSQTGRLGDFYTLFPYLEISTRFPSFQYAIDTILTRKLVYLARRRKLEVGEGLLTLTPKSYRQQWGTVDDSDGEVIFNWWTLGEIKIAKERSEVFGGTRILSKLARFLISSSTDRFPVALYATPFSENDEVLDEILEVKHAHLMFTTSLDPEEVLKGQDIYLIERETVALTDLIPNSVNAEVDIRKLHDYCLNPEHSQGKHKARLFAAIFGITVQDAEELRHILLAIVTEYEAQPGRSDEFGQRYTIDFPLKWQDRNATIRSGWIVEHHSDIPRLTTCYPL